MPITLGNTTYYRTAEAANIIGINKSTLQRWIRAGKINEASKKDIRGWRLFTEEDIKNIKEFAETTTNP